AGAAHLMRISVAGHRVRQAGHRRMERRRTPGKARHGEVEATPEEMNRAYFAKEAGAELLEDAIGLGEHSPKSMRSAGVIGPMPMVLREPDRIRDLARQVIDRHGDAKAGQRADDALMELGHRLWL